MLLIKSYIDKSQIHGIGCFAAERIKKGQIVWVFNKIIDNRLPVEEYLKFPQPVKEYYDMYGYFEKHNNSDVVVLCGDHAKHMNHSDNPNLLDDFENYCNIAVRDIEIGEELTCNYKKFDSHYSEKLGI